MIFWMDPKDWASHWIFLRRKRERQQEEWYSKTTTVPYSTYAIVIYLQHIFAPPRAKCVGCIGTLWPVSLLERFDWLIRNSQ